MLSAFSLTPAARSIATVPNHIARLPAAILFGATGFVLSYALGLSHYPNLRTRFRIVALVTLFVMIETLGILVIADFVYYKQIGRYILVYAGGLLWSVCIITRLLWYNNVKHAVHCIIVFGDNYVLGPLNSMLKRSTFPIRLLARPIAGVAQQDSNSFDGILNNRELHEVLVHGEKALHSDLLLAAMDRGITVSTFDSFSERHFFKIPSEFLSHAWFFQVDLRRQHPFYASIKRGVDIALSLVGTLLSAPILIVAIALIKLTSRGPVFYSQKRVGVGQNVFTIWKLRSMRIDSEKSGPQWAKAKDPRVTRVGRLFRKTRIDELPQFWNILHGEMSFIGPRPERPEFVEKLAGSIPYYRQRHLIKPGLTGWAQICYQYGASEEDAREKLSYDLYYLKNASFMLDMQIILQTIGAIAKGAR